jgi:2-C-methyl-D-erythritol 4-phosphate cytidylyltransferase
MKVWAVIPTAGIGQRMRSETPKPFLMLAGESVIARTLKVFEASAVVDGIVVVGHENSLADLRSLVAENGFCKVCTIIPGGATRTQSVRNGLNLLPKDVDIVIVHDGVRPLVTLKMIEEGVRVAGESGAAVAAVPVKPTLKVIDPRTLRIRETLDRTLVWEVQTPQVFRRELLERAYRGDVDATDDAALVEKMGVPVLIYAGDERNIKITTPDDLVIAEAFLGSSDIQRRTAER